MAAKNLMTRTTRKLLVSRRFVSSRREYSLWAPDFIVKSPHKDVEISSRTVPEQVWENLERWADKSALVCSITNRGYSYHQLYKYSRNFATKLRTQLGIRDGDVICMMMPNSPEYAIATLGALQAGAEVTTVNPNYTPHEIEKQFTLSNPKLVIGVTETITVIKEALVLAKKDLPIIAIRGADSGTPPGTILFEEFAFAENVDHSVLKEVGKTADDIAFLPYSSGTTGLPKGVELTHRNIVANCMQMDVDTARLHTETTKTNQDSTLAVLPFYHIYGMVVSMLHKLSVGYKLVTVPRFQPDTFIHALKEHQIHLLLAAPPLILFLGSHANVKKEHLDSIKRITSGGAPLPTTDVNRILEKFKPGADLLQVYGLTETSPLACHMLPGSKEYWTAGYPLPSTELRIVDVDLRPLGPNQVGELLIKGPQLMKGYRNNPDATKNAITVDGWFRTGDLASINEIGVLTISDRLKELIKVKGFQVPPAELESVLKTHPDVLDAGVIGVPDQRTGEAPKAFVVLKDGHKVDSKEIATYVAERVAEYKRIKEVIILDALPKNPSGKLLRKVLKEKYA